MRKILSFLLIFIGLISLFYCFTLLLQRYNPNKLSFDNFPIKEERGEIGEGEPISLAIKSIDIYAPVIPVTKTGDKWEITNKGVAYLSSSPLPGEIGNSILYGHNFNNILGDLKKVKKKDQIEIQLSTGETLIFIVNDIRVVNASDSYVLDSSADRRITLYTCTGFLDSKRLVVTGLLREDQLGAL